MFKKFNKNNKTLKQNEWGKKQKELFLFFVKKITCNSEQGNISNKGTKKCELK
jgi:hypothetical protein